MLVAPLADAPPLRRQSPPQLVKAASPAAGANFVQHVDDGLWWRLITVFCRLVTSADAADRGLRIEYRDEADNIYAVMGNPVTYPANTTEDFAFSIFQGQGEWEVVATNLVPLHPILLQPAHDFAITVGSIDNTDQLSRVRFLVEKFYPPSADDYPAFD